MLDYQLYADEELLSLLKIDDHAAFTEIYIRYSGTLYNHAYNLLKNRNDVKDIVQEIFTTLWNNRSNLQINTNLAGYLYVATRNKVLKTMSHQQVKAKYLVVFQATMKEGSLNTDYLVREKQLTEIIEQEINELPGKMRQILILSRKSFLTHKEIAQKLNLSEKTVKKQVNNSLKILRLKLQSYLILIIQLNLLMISYI